MIFIAITTLVIAICNILSLVYVLNPVKFKVYFKLLFDRKEK